MIDMAEFDIQIGDPVLVVVEHEDGCNPKLLNPEVLLPKSTFEVGEMSCTADGLLSWTTTGESGKLSYQIEQFRWNKWVVIGEVAGVGTEGLNKYTFNITPHSGENKIRISQTDNTGKKETLKKFPLRVNHALSQKWNKPVMQLNSKKTANRLKLNMKFLTATGTL
ncbi:MAG: hypothetical protein IPM74_16985 [Crocinitomicaceae bacterium]|nr:hypothetical protein [Crocinitomicaceae bacterium]